MDKILNRSYLVVDVLENQVKKKVDCCPTRGMGRKIRFNKEFSLLVWPAIRKNFFRRAGRPLPLGWVEAGQN